MVALSTHRGRVAVEAVVVAVVTGAALLLLSLAVPLRSAPVVFGAGAALGAVAHLGFEALGVNRWYCTHGAACS